VERINRMTPRDRAIAFTALAAVALVVVVALLFAVRSAAPGGVTAPGATAPGPSAPGATAPGSTTPGTTSPGPTAPGSTPIGSPSPTPAPTPVAIPSLPTVVALPPPDVPPVGAAVARPVAPAATRAPAVPTPTPDPNIWRVEGVLIDDSTKLPIPEVCVVIGPHGCQRGSPRTDVRGVFYFDVPKIRTVFYDLYFVKDGFWTVWVRIKPEAPSVYNLALTPR